MSWEIRQSPAINSLDYDIYKVGTPASGGKIARVFGREGMAQGTTAFNARLIAAAPEMLELLVALISTQSNILGGNTVEAVSSILKTVRGDQP